MPRGRSTLVSWRVADAQADVQRLGEAGFVVRSIPGRELVRASVGAWSSEEELERLVQGGRVGLTRNPLRVRVDVHVAAPGETAQRHPSLLGEGYRQ